MAMLTLGQAARLAGVGKTTLTRAIKAGRLSATRTEAGTYEIDPSELARWRPFPAPGEATGATVAATGSVARQETPDATRAALAEQALSDARSQIADLRADLVDARVDRDHWREQAQRLALAGPPPRPPWWRRLLGG